MKDKLSSLDVKYLLQDLQFLLGARLDTIAKHDTLWCLEFYVPSKGKQFMSIALGKYFYASAEKPDANKQETENLILYLRKYLGGTLLQSISQIDAERILKLTFQLKDTKYILIIEMFSKGNIILCDKDMKIMRALENQSFKDRQIKSGVLYDYPKSKYNLFSQNSQKFSSVIKENPKDSIVKNLAIDIGMGGVYAEEACLRAGIDKHAPSVSDKGLKQLFAAVKGMVEGQQDAAIISTESNELLDVVPITLKLYQDKKAKKFESFNAAVASSFSQYTPKKESKYDKEIRKIEKIIEQEKQKLLELEKQELVEKAKAEALYTKYQLIDEILTEIKKARQKYSWKEIKEKLKEHKIIKDVNEREGKIEIEF